MRNLIPVHINKARDNTYFYNWSSDLKKWIRGKKIPAQLKRLYKIPNIYNNGYDN